MITEDQTKQDSANLIESTYKYISLLIKKYNTKIPFKTFMAAIRLGY